MNWKYTSFFHHGKSTRCVSMDCELTNFEHDYWASSVSCGILMVLPLYRQCTAAVYIQSVPSFLTCYGRSNMNACIPSMTCHPRFSWTALLFSSIHWYTKLLHHQMFTCMFAADEGSLSVFQHVNSLAMHLNMSWGSLVPLSYYRTVL